jgi:hypothetical protein
MAIRWPPCGHHVAGDEPGGRSQGPLAREEASGVRRNVGVEALGSGIAAA